MLSENTFVSGSKDIIILNINDSSCIKTLKGHTDFVKSFVLSTNGSLISGFQDSTIKVWDIEKSVCTQTLLGHTDVVFSVILLNDGNLTSASADSTIKILNS